MTDRTRLVLLAELAERRAAFNRLDPQLQRAIDSERCLPTTEMHRLLDFFVWHGRFADEFPSGWIRSAGHRPLSAKRVASRS